MESAYDAAQRFIDENGISQHFLRQISEWIAARAGKQTPTIGAGPGSVGGSNNGSGIGSGTRQYQFFPSAVAGFVVFDDIPTGFQTKVLTKIRELNSTCDAVCQLSDGEMEAVERVVGVLVATSHYHFSSVATLQVLYIIYKMQ